MSRQVVRAVCDEEEKDVMARARSLKPGFFNNEDLIELAFEYRLLFAGLWTIADREGRLEDRPKKIKLSVFPGDDVDVEHGLAQLEHRKFIVRYVANGIRYIQVASWSKHQSPHIKEAPSAIPAPGEHRADTSVAALIPSSLTPDSGLLTPDSGLPVPRADAPSSFDLIAAIKLEYPEGLHRGDHWALAEREASKLLDAGEPPELLIAAAKCYREQQEACGTLGTDAVLRPHNFFGKGAWRGPFPLPAQKTNGKKLTWHPTE